MARKILLADDSVTAQNMGRRILTDAGYEVITVNNGSAAFKKIAEMLPELIVLDVYMPGYSGLEVCQRLKETRETANIPILLTVGKLEPFKPEEARRVRADAFIVKPFEASELLTALTRLEDKIVPRPAAQKGSGQFAKAWAALEETETSKSPAKGEKFGDRETGWKDRLIIPSGTPKAEEPEEEVAPAAKKSKGSKKDERSVPEIAIPGTVPPDITSEEMAAIAAAAAAFENKEQPAPVEAVAKVDAPEVAPLPVVAPEPEAPPVESKSEVVVSEKEIPAAVSVTEVAAATSAVSKEKVEAKAEKEEVETEPVAAKAKEISKKPDEVVAIAAVSLEKVEQARVARWIAHEVPLEPSERGSILDEEMRAAGAVLQAATGGVDFSAATLLAKEPVAPAVEPAPVDAPAVAAAPVVEEIPAPVVEPVVAVVETPSTPETVDAVSATVQEPTAAAKEDAAYAAAASASSAVVEATAPEVTVSPSPIAETIPTLSEPEKPQPEAELAAAWAQWKEIRETVVGPQLTSKTSDSDTTAPGESQKTESVEPAAPPSNPTAIASMVDSMLAELKPKLMEEIARKLANEKKKD